MPLSSSQIATLVARVADAEGLWTLLRDGLDWPIQDPERATRRQTEIADGISGGEVDVRRLRPLGVEDARPVFLVEFQARPYGRRDLRALLRSVRRTLRESGETGVSDVDDVLFVVVQPGWRDVRFVLFRPRENGAPEIRSFGWEGGAAGRTVLDANLPGLAWDRRERWQEAFNVEGLTEAFYRAYEERFKALRARVTGARDEAQAHEWTQLLMNRLLFVGFVERMGGCGFRLPFLSLRREEGVGGWRVRKPSRKAPLSPPGPLSRKRKRGSRRAATSPNCTGGTWTAAPTRT